MQCGAGVVTSAELGRRAPAWAAECSWERCARETIQVYEATA
jgi:hypothetical protein